MIEVNKVYKNKDPLEERLYWFTTKRANGFGDGNPEGMGFEVIVLCKYGLDVEVDNSFLYDQHEDKFLEVDEQSSKKIIENMIDILEYRNKLDKKALRILKRVGLNK